MSRAITFIPSARSGVEPHDLHYVERASRHRSIQALFQDAGGSAVPSRRQFLQKAYRRVVSHFMLFGRIEHPLPFLRELTRYLDGLSRRVDCRIEDFRGLGVYVLLQDGATFYLLASRDGRVSIDDGRGWTRLDHPDAGFVTELPVETATAQHELFSQSVRDFLGLYRIDVTRMGDRPVRFLMGGASQTDTDAVLEEIDSPVGSEGGDERALGSLSGKLLYADFDAVEPRRDPTLDGLRGAPRSRRRWGGAVTAAAVLVLISAAGVWLSNRMTDEPSDDVAATDGARNERVARQAEPMVRERSEPIAETVVPDEDAAADAVPEGVEMSVDWEKRYRDAVTSSPVVDGDAVIFGARDGNLYALDVGTGEEKWRYGAEDGVGASPVVVGRAVIGADYGGNVFSLDRDTGKPLWARDLPQKIVSTPAVAGGEVAVGCLDGIVYGVSLETGRVLWKAKTGARVRASAAANEDAFFVGSYDGYLYALARGTGDVRWKARVGGQLSSSPATDGERVVVGHDRGITAYSAADGAELWRFRSGEPVKSFVEIAGGRVYVGGNEGHVYCLDTADGSEIWRFRTGGPVLSRPRVVDGVVFVTSYDRNVYCLDASTGEKLDEVRTSGPVFSSPAVARGGVYFGNNEGAFYRVSYQATPSRGHSP